MLFEQRAVARTFDTPAFRGMTFFEVQARSIINGVPEASRLPFRWTINPYRGCSHSCVYCMSGETPILLADGRTKRLSELHTGDAVYGTVRRDTYRHYVPTTVLAHWQTVKPACRVTLEDGTQLIPPHVTKLRTPVLVSQTPVLADGRRETWPNTTTIGVAYQA